MASVKPQTRDNLIYLAVGISVAALVVADVLYSEKHGTKDVDAIEIRLSCCDQLGPVDVLCCQRNAKKKGNAYANPSVGPFRGACAARSSVRFAQDNQSTSRLKLLGPRSDRAVFRLA